MLLRTLVIYALFCSAALADKPRLVIPGPGSRIPEPDWGDPYVLDRKPLGEHWKGWEIVEEHHNYFLVRVPGDRPEEFYVPKHFVVKVGYRYPGYHGTRKIPVYEQWTLGYVAGDLCMIFRGNRPYPAIVNTGSHDQKVTDWFNRQYGSSRESVSSGQGTQRRQYGHRRFRMRTMY